MNHESGESSALFTETIQRLGVPASQVNSDVHHVVGGRSVVVSPQRAGQTRVGFKEVTLTSLAQAQQLFNVPSRPLTADILHTVGINHVSELERLRDDDVELLRRLGSLHVFGGVEMPEAVKQKIARALLPATLSVAAVSELTVAKGQQVVLNASGAVAFDKVTIQDGGHLVIPNNMTLTIGKLIKAKG